LPELFPKYCFFRISKVSAILAEVCIHYTGIQATIHHFKLQYIIDKYVIQQWSRPAF